jgi:uncharacterized membrane protein
MKRLLGSALVAALVCGPFGCNKSPEGGAPGTDNSFKLSGGTIPNSIKPGDAESVKVSVERGKNFHDSVRLEAKAPEKIHATLDRNLVKDGESPDVNVRIHPNEDAAPGDYKVTVTGTSDHGSPTNLELTVKVVKK